MMKKSQRMNTIVKLARHREHDAVAMLNRCRQELEEKEGQLQELQQYQHDYMRRLESLGGGGADISKINEYRRFISQLSGAIALQQKLVEENRHELALRSQSWHEARLDFRVLGNYQQRCKTQEYQALMKQEQKESDERAQHIKSD